MKPNGKPPCFQLARALSATLDLFIFLLGKLRRSVTDTDFIVFPFSSSTSRGRSRFHRVLRRQCEARIFLRRQSDRIRATTRHNFHKDRHHLWPLADSRGKIQIAPLHNLIRRHFVYFFSALRFRLLIVRCGSRSLYSLERSMRAKTA